MTRPRQTGMALAVARAVVLGIAVWATSLAGAAQDGSPGAVRQRLQAYLDAYERELGPLVADERFEQWPLDGAVPFNAQPRGTYFRSTIRLRTLESTVAFVPLPANAGWLGFRDVQRVKGRPVARKGPPLAELLALDAVDARDRALALLLASARHNLGAPRTINLPSLPLELLHQRNEARFVIDRVSHDRAGDCDAMRLDLVETVTPTLIQRPEGGDMPSRVAAWVEPATGRLCRAEVRTRDARLGASKFEALVSVDFAHDPVVGITVPVRMREVFLVPPRGAGEGEATYSNYRRVVPPAR